MPRNAESAHVEVQRLLAAHGWNSTSFQVLGSGYAYYFCEPAACVAYSPVPGAFVAAGAPIASRSNWADVAAEFVRHAASARRRVCFFAVEAPFVRTSGLAAMQVGEQPVWDPSKWAEQLSHHRSLREQLRRARAHGVTVRRVEAEELEPAAPLRHAMVSLIARWQASRPMAPMGFLVQVEPFSFMSERRIFVAESNQGLMGLLGIVPVYARRGWLFENLLRDPRAPNGTAELLVDAAMRQVADEGCLYVTLGLAPLAGQIDPWLAQARKMTASLYDFAGLYAFKAKLQPNAWEPIYLAYPQGQPAWRTVVDVLRAFAPQGLMRFGLNTLLRGPAVVVKSLAALLVPWTLGLVCIDTATWFPAPWVQDAWVLFDLFLCAALTWLNRRWNQALATLLASLITADAVLTLVEAIAFTPHTGPVAWLVKAIAVGAPSLAAVVLWGARAHRKLWV